MVSHVSTVYFYVGIFPHFIYFQLGGCFNHHQVEIRFPYVEFYLMMESESTNCTVVWIDGCRFTM